MERKHSRNAAHVHGWDDYGRQVRTAWAMWCDEWIRRCNHRLRAGVLNAAICESLRASRHSRCCPLWSHRCWKCACRCTHFSVTICHSYLFVNFCIRSYCIHKFARFLLKFGEDQHFLKWLNAAHFGEEARLNHFVFFVIAYSHPIFGGGQRSWGVPPSARL